jgi:hypothetical protein
MAASECNTSGNQRHTSHWELPNDLADRNLARLSSATSTGTSTRNRLSRSAPTTISQTTQGIFSASSSAITFGAQLTKKSHCGDGLLAANADHPGVSQSQPPRLLRRGGNTRDAMPEPWWIGGQLSLRDRARALDNGGWVSRSQIRTARLGVAARWSRYLVNAPYV